MSIVAPVTAAGTAPRTRRAVMASRLRWLARVLAGLVIAAWSLLLVAWLTLHWGILPHVDEWRPQIAARASAALGVAVRIGRIDVRSNGWIPTLELRDVALHDADGRPALELPRVVAALSPRSLFALDVRFSQLLIDGAHLEVRRDAAGRVVVGGLDFSGPDTGDRSATNWFFRQPEFVIRSGSITWRDEQRDAPPLSLTDVQLVVRNGLRRHAIRLDATPPAEWGERFSVRGRFTHSLLRESGDWRHWSGTLHADLPRADVSELRRHVALPFQLTEGDGAVRAWLDVREGEAQSATVDLALREVNLRLADDVAPLALAQIEGRLAAVRLERGWRLAARQFGFLTGDGIRWPRGDLSFAWRDVSNGVPAGGDFAAQRLDLALMAQVATRVPLGQTVRQLLAELAPQGSARELTAHWQGPLDRPDTYVVRGVLSDLSLAAKAQAQADAVGRPGLRNATIVLNATEKGGDARLAIARGGIELPGVFAEPLVALDQLGASLQWRIEPSRTAGAPPRIALAVKDVRFANADAQGELSGTWTTGPGEGTARGGRYPGQLELTGKLTRGVATSVARYLPLGLPDDTRSYVARAVRAGQVNAMTVRVRGDLWDFPFHRIRNPKDGEFRIAGHVEDVELAYMPGMPAEWPPFTRVRGELVFDRASMEIRNAQARVYGVDLANVQGGIRNLVDKPVLAIDGTARGPLADLLRYVNASPVGGWIDHALGKATGTGLADLRLALSIPLTAPDASTVKGSLALAGNDVRIAPGTPLLGAARARIDFTQKGFTVANGAARVLGGDAAFDGGLQADGTLRFNGQGSATADGLRRASEFGALSRLASSFTGQAAYRVKLAFPKGHADVEVTSNLVGMASDLPPPLRKTAEQPLPMRYATTFAPESLAPGQVPRDTLRLELGNVVAAQFVREWKDDGERVLRGGIGVLDALPAPAHGVAANVNVQTFNADAWDAVSDRVFGTAAAGSAAAPAASAPRGAAPATPSGGTAGSTPGATAGPAVGGTGAGTAANAGGGAGAGAGAGTGTGTGTGAGSATVANAGSDAGDGGYAPGTIAIRARELVSGGRRLTNVVGGFSLHERIWRGNIDADQLNGYIEYRPTRRPGVGGGRVYARLSRLSLPRSEADDVANLLDQQTTTVPALDIVVDDFELRGKRLGRVEIDALNRTADGVREWRLNRLSMTVPEARFNASGRWAPAGAGSPKRRSVLDFKLDLADSGAFLERLGMGRTIKGGKGSLAGQVAWLGSPMSIDFPSLSGQVNVAIDAGQFLKVQPGPARLLSVLSLQSLPRRLALDFRDLFQEGFAFDAVTGDVTIDQGVANTNNLRMRGVQAVVLMEGSADIERETQDLRVVVVPEINAGTASLAYAVINPAIGIGSFLAQVFLRKPLTEAGTREFHVTGPWSDPKVERVQRKLFATDADATSTAEPAKR